MEYLIRFIRVRFGTGDGVKNETVSRNGSKAGADGGIPDPLVLQKLSDSNKKQMAGFKGVDRKGIMARFERHQIKELNDFTIQIELRCPGNFKVDKITDANIKLLGVD